MKVAKIGNSKVSSRFHAWWFSSSTFDKFGKRPLELPKPDRNDLYFFYQVRPLGEPC